MIALLMPSPRIVVLVHLRRRVLRRPSLTVFCCGHSNESEEQLGRNFDARIVLHELCDLLLLALVEDFDAIARRELCDDFRERMSRDDGDVCVIEVGFRVVCEYVVDLFFKVGDGLASAAVRGLCSHRDATHDVSG
jgi:hypothetical protein